MDGVSPSSVFRQNGVGFGVIEFPAPMLRRGNRLCFGVIVELRIENKGAGDPVGEEVGDNPPSGNESFDGRCWNLLWKAEDDHSTPKLTIEQCRVQPHHASIRLSVRLRNCPPHHRPSTISGPSGIKQRTRDTTPRCPQGRQSRPRTLFRWPTAFPPLPHSPCLSLHAPLARGIATAPLLPRASSFRYRSSRSDPRRARFRTAFVQLRAAPVSTLGIRFDWAAALFGRHRFLPNKKFVPLLLFVITQSLISF